MREQRARAVTDQLFRGAEPARASRGEQYAGDVGGISCCGARHVATILKLVTQARLGLAHVNDAPAIAAMSRQLIEHGLAWSWNEDRVERCLRNRDCVVLAARDRRRLIGFAIMEFYAIHAHLNLLAVQPGHQRQGIGRQLLDWLEASARTAGIFKVHLELRATNDGARAFYEKVGYRTVGRKVAYYDGREDALRMTHDLTVTSTSSTERQ